MTKNHDALCGRCKVPLEVLSEDEREIGRCPNCGNSDTLDNIVRIVGDYVLEQTAQGLEKVFTDAARTSKGIISYKPGFRPQRSYRFIVDVNAHR